MATLLGVLLVERSRNFKIGGTPDTSLRTLIGFICITIKASVKNNNLVDEVVLLVVVERTVVVSQLWNGQIMLY